MSPESKCHDRSPGDKCKRETETKTKSETQPTESGLEGPQMEGPGRQVTSETSRWSLRGRAGPCRARSGEEGSPRPVKQSGSVKSSRDKTQRAPPWQEQE